MRRTMGQKSEHHSRGHYGPSICPDPHSHNLDAAPAKFEGLQQGRGRITAPAHWRHMPARANDLDKHLEARQVQAQAQARDGRASCVSPRPGIGLTTDKGHYQCRHDNARFPHRYESLISKSCARPDGKGLPNKDYAHIPCFRTWLQRRGAIPISQPKPLFIIHVASRSSRQCPLGADDQVFCRTIYPRQSLARQHAAVTGRRGDPLKEERRDERAS